MESNTRQRISSASSASSVHLDFASDRTGFKHSVQVASPINPRGGFALSSAASSPALLPASATHPSAPSAALSSSSSSIFASSSFAASSSSSSSSPSSVAVVAPSASSSSSSSSSSSWMPSWASKSAAPRLSGGSGSAASHASPSTPTSAHPSATTFASALAPSSSSYPSYGSASYGSASHGSGSASSSARSPQDTAPALLQKGPFALECVRLFITGGATVHGRVHLRSARGFLAHQVVLKIYDNVSIAAASKGANLTGPSRAPEHGNVYHEIVLYQSGHQDREVPIAPGIYSFPFKIQLPRNIPPTFHHPGHGKDSQFRTMARCTYTVEATMTRLDGGVLHSSSSSLMCVGDLLDSKNLALRSSPETPFKIEQEGPFQAHAVLEDGAGFVWEGKPELGVCCRVADELQVNLKITQFPWETVVPVQQDIDSVRIITFVSLERTVSVEPPQGSTRERCSVTETIASKETAISVITRQETLSLEVPFFIGDAVIKNKRDLESVTASNHHFTPTVLENATYTVTYTLVVTAIWQGKTFRATLPITIFQSEHYRDLIKTSSEQMLPTIFAPLFDERTFPMGKIYGWLFKASTAPVIGGERWRWRWCVIDDDNFFTWYDMNYIGTDQFEFKKRKSADVAQCYFQNLEDSSLEKKVYCWRFFPGKRSDRLRIYRLSSPNVNEHSKWCAYFNDNACILDLNRFAPPGKIAGEVLKLGVKTLWNTWERRWCSIDDDGIFRYFVINSEEEPTEGMYNHEASFELRGDFDLNNCRFQTMNSAEFAGLRTKLPASAQNWKGFFKILPLQPKKLKAGAAKEYYFAVPTADDAYTWVSSHSKPSN